MQDCPENGSVGDFDGSFPAVVAGLFAFELGFFAEEDGVIGFWDEGEDGDEDDGGEDYEEVVAPAPGGVVVYEAAHDWRCCRSEEWRGAVDKHGTLEGVFGEHVAYRATGDG